MKNRIKRIKPHYEDYHDIVVHMKSGEAGALTIAFNQALVDGVTIEKLQEISREKAEELGVKRRDETSIQQHIGWMEKREGWIFETKDGVIKLVGLNNDAKIPRTDTASYKTWQVKTLLRK